MTTLLLPLALSLGAVGGSLAWHVARRRQQALKMQADQRRWARLFAHATEPAPGPTSPVYMVATRHDVGGEIVVRPDGLCLRLSAHPGRTAWVPWPSVRRLEPTEKGGAVLRLRADLTLALGVDACRAVWEAQAAGRRPRPTLPPATPPAGQRAATAS